MSTPNEVLNISVTIRGENKKETISLRKKNYLTPDGHLNHWSSRGMSNYQVELFDYPEMGQLNPAKVVKDYRIKDTEVQIAQKFNMCVYNDFVTL